MGESERAIKRYDKAVELNPNNVTASISRCGNQEAYKGDFDNAIKDDTEAIDPIPSSHGRYNNRAIIWQKRKYWTKLSRIC